MGSVLVTGGTGFLGKYVARSLAEAGEQVVITYRRYFSAPQFLADIMESKVKAARCDVLDLPELLRVIRDHGVDSIVHLAHISNYEAPIYTCLQTNVLGTINLLEAAAITSVKKITYCSSNSIAMSHGTGGPSMGVEDENVPIVSGAVAVIPPSKKVGEILSLYYGATFGISVAIVRPSLIYGPYGEAEVGNLKVLRSILRGVTTGKPVDLPNVGKDDEFRLVYVGDVSAGTTVVHRASINQHRAYCLDGEKPTSWGEIGEIMKELVPGSKITFGKSSQPARGRQAPAERNITREFGFKPKYGMKEGLRELIEWYQKERS
ncbi:NAD-dependent epimerase/dehydratase family protein [Chloroflexota bacterium]